MLQIFDVVIRSVRSRHGGRSLRFWTEGIADPIPERETALAIQEIAGRVAVWPALGPAARAARRQCKVPQNQVDPGKT